MGGSTGDPSARSSARTTVARFSLAATLIAAAALALTTLAATQPRPSAGPDGSPQGSPTAAPSPTTGTATALPTPTPTATPSPTPVLVTDALTGTLVAPSDAARPVIAVMIDDLAPARPQSGFNAAGVVWQAPAEGGIPRYMLLFHAAVPTAVGPVRSAREYFVEWAAEWRAMYSHAGGSPQALQTLRARGSGQWVWNADEFAWAASYWRVTSRFAPHNLYTDGQHLAALATRLGATPASSAPVWSFTPAVPLQRRPEGGSIVVAYAYERITYRYDRQTNTYRRFLDGAATAQVDAADGQVVAPSNVVILRMAFGPLNDGHPNKHRLEASNVGKGVAWISTNGITVKGTWRKASATAPTLLFGPDGRPVKLTVGQTFVQVMQLGDLVTIRDGAVPAPPAIRPFDRLPL